MSSNRLVHVARDGKVIGQYPPEQLASLMDTGHFLESDLCYSDVCPEWTPLPEFLKKVDAPRYSRAKHGTEPSPSKSSSGRGRHRGKKDMPLLLSGWIAFLLALSGLVGAGFWIASLYHELDQKTVRIKEMEKDQDKLEKENQKLLFASRELAEPGFVRGSIILRNDAGKRVSLPGTQVFLYARKTIEEYLEAQSRTAMQQPSLSPGELAAFFVENLPQALNSTTTDASGRFEFKVPEPGEYVLFSRLATVVQGSQMLRLWFVAFNSQDPINSLVTIDETNSVQQFIPSLMIVEGR